MLAYKTSSTRCQKYISRNSPPSRHMLKSVQRDGWIMKVNSNTHPVQWFAANTIGNTHVLLARSVTGVSTACCHRSRRAAANETPRRVFSLTHSMDGWIAIVLIWGRLCAECIHLFLICCTTCGAERQQHASKRVAGVKGARRANAPFAN